MPTISEAATSYKRMTARKKVKDLAIRQSFLTYLNDWNKNPDYRELRNEWKMRMLRSDAEIREESMQLILLSAPLLLSNKMPPKQ